MNTKKIDIVLVHGGWHGGWVWKDVEKHLRSEGFNVHSPTMTGLGERSHLADGDITPDSHVTDIENVLRWNEIENAILVGHSYGGFVITGVASRLPERICGLIYLDAFVPTESGQSAETIGSKSRIDQVKASATEDGMVPPSNFEFWSADADIREWLKKLTTPHPLKCFIEGTTLTGRESEVKHKLFLLCENYKPSPFHKFYEKYRNAEGWKTKKLKSLHDAMVEVPQEVSSEISNFATEISKL